MRQGGPTGRQTNHQWSTHATPPHRRKPGEPERQTGSRRRSENHRRTRPAAVRRRPVTSPIFPFLLLIPSAAITPTPPPRQNHQATRRSPTRSPIPSKRQAKAHRKAGKKGKEGRTRSAEQQLRRAKPRGWADRTTGRGRNTSGRGRERDTRPRDDDAAASPRARGRVNSQRG